MVSTECKDHDLMAIVVSMLIAAAPLVTLFILWGQHRRSYRFYGCGDHPGE